MRTRFNRLPILAVAAVCWMTAACGGGSGNSSTPAAAPPPSSVSVVVSPGSATVQLNATQQFTATVSGTSNMAVNWEVNGTVGGNATVGTISISGLYQAPAVVPNPTMVTVAAVSQADMSKSGPASVTIITPNQAPQSVPIKLGTSGGNALDVTHTGNSTFCCSGTLGSLVQRGGTQFILSNNHVLARSNQAAIGEPIIQPGLADLNCQASSGTTVANLSQFADLKTSNVDAAIAAVVPGDVDTSGAILELGPSGAAPPANSVVAPAVGMSVAKSGRSTALTCSTIQSINTSLSVDYTTSCQGGTTFTVTFTNQVIIGGVSFSAAGDSGSLVVSSQTAQPVALLFAGASNNTAADPIQDVLNALNGPGGTPSIVGGGMFAITCPMAPSTTGAAPSQQAVSVSEQKQSVAAAVKDKYAPQLMTDPAVLGVGVGASSDAPGDAAIFVYVEEGKPHGPIPPLLDGVRTKLLFTRRFHALTPESQPKVEVAQAGVSLADAEVRRATAAKERNEQRIMTDPAIIGVGVGASQDSPGEAAIVLYVEQGKQPASIPAQIENVRTRVVNTDRFRAFGWNEQAKALSGGCPAPRPSPKKLGGTVKGKTPGWVSLLAKQRMPRDVHERMNQTRGR